MNDIKEIFDFRIHDDYIEVKDLKILFYRFYPPNLSILTDYEKETEIEKLSDFLDSIFMPFQFFAIDKVEDLSENKEFFNSMDKQYSKYTNQIVEEISNMEISEDNTNSVQRAYYIVVQVKDLTQKETIDEAFKSNQFKYYLAHKTELITATRNFVLREFLPFDLYHFETEKETEYKEKYVDTKGLKKFFTKNITQEKYIQTDLTTRLTPQRFACQPRHIMQNDLLRRVIIIKNFPPIVDSLCMLSKLSQIKNTTFSMRGTPLMESQASSLINNQINNKTSVFSKTKKSTQIMDAEFEKDNIENFYRQLQNSKNKIYYINIFIEMYGSTEKELKDVEIKIKNLLQVNKITYESLRYEQKEGFLSVSPLSKDQFIKSANNFPTNTLASLYPFSFSNRNDKNGLFLGKTIDGGYMFVDFDARNENISNGNYSIIGKSGQGKTWLQKKIISQEIFKSTTYIGFDPDKDYIETVHTLGGTNINAASGTVKINPFEIRCLNDPQIEKQLESELIESVDAFKQKNIFYQHLSWLREFFGVLFTDITQKELNALMILTKDMYEINYIDENTDFEKLSSIDYPIFSDLYKYINKVYESYDAYKNKYNMITTDILKSLILTLYDCHDGSLGFLFNGHTNIKNSRIINFDLNDLLAGSRDRLQAVMFNIITYVWNRIAKRKESIIFCVDELSLLLNRKNPVIINYLRDFAKRIRKYGSKMGTVTQQLEDYNDPDIQHLTKPIFSNTDFKFLFYPDHFDLKTVQDMLKLTDGEIDCISKPKQRHCLLKAGDDKYYFKVGNLPYENKLFGKLSG